MTPPYCACIPCLSSLSVLNKYRTATHRILFECHRRPKPVIIFIITFLIKRRSICILTFLRNSYCRWLVTRFLPVFLLHLLDKRGDFISEHVLYGWLYPGHSLHECDGRLEKPSTAVGQVYTHSYRNNYRKK